MTKTAKFHEYPEVNTWNCRCFSEMDTKTGLKTILFREYILKTRLQNFRGRGM